MASEGQTIAAGNFPALGKKSTFDTFIEIGSQSHTSTSNTMPPEKQNPPTSPSMDVTFDNPRDIETQPLPATRQTESIKRWLFAIVVSILVCGLNTVIAQLSFPSLEIEWSYIIATFAAWLWAFSRPPRPASTTHSNGHLITRESLHMFSCGVIFTAYLCIAFVMLYRAYKDLQEREAKTEDLLMILETMDLIELVASKRQVVA
ncbi:hypothetical protein VTL71DRAFT_13207 [Oculimacula yallundae]|uniref:Uncharacterized protein n=1 Tax=Oculimacula yallundae TaxID=86028 RepID=A0ABR4CJP2_9HELO